LRFASAAAAFVVVFCAPLAAADEPRFSIESIRVTGIRYVSPDIVIAESRLAVGRSYTEVEIRDAVARVHRLPFVLDADVRLEKGSVRGTYVVVLRVTETKPLFGSWRSSVDMAAVIRIENDPATGRPRTVSSGVFRDHTDRESIGGRFFLGSRSMFALTADIGGTDPLGAGDNRYSLAFTRYDVLGTRASIAALVQYREFAQHLDALPSISGATTTSFGDHLIWNVSAALPLRGNQALRATWHREARTRFVNPENEDLIVRRSVNVADAAWIYDTTNDLLFPTAGVYATAKLTAGRDSRYEPVEPSDPQRQRADYFWRRELTAGVTRYWEVTPRQSLVGGFEILKTANAELLTGRAGYTANLWSGRSGSELRLYLEAQPANSSPGGFRATGRAGLAFRNVWGTARFDFTYSGWRPGNE
jgi:hypothetical protein